MRSVSHSQKPLLSVIMPVYNCALYVREAIDSILNQTFEDFELVIADDGSSDESRTLINGYADKRIRTFHNTNNEGKTSTINRLFKETRGALVTIHDADDISLADRFKFQLDHFFRNPSLVLCGSNFITIDMRGRTVGKIDLLSENDALKQNLFTQSQFHGPTVIFRRECAMRLSEIYRPFFKDYNEDYDFFFRLSEYGDVINCTRHLYKYRITSGSLSRSLTVQKRISPKLVQFLALQRKETGRDDLMDGRTDRLEAMFKELSHPYEVDPSLIFREQAELDFYYQFYKRALLNSLRAIVMAPMTFRNYRLIQYILRKRILGF